MALAMQIRRGGVMAVVMVVLLYAVPSSSSSSSLDVDVNALLQFKAGIMGDSNNVLFNWSRHNAHGICNNWAGVGCSSLSSHSPHERRVVRLDLAWSALSDVFLSGVLSPFLCNLTFLTYLSLSNNDFFGPIPKEIGRLSRLQNLDLYSTAIQGPIPYSLRNCSGLEGLGLHLEGKGLSIIAPWLLNFTSLRELRLDISNLKGDMPEELGKLSELHILTLTLYWQDLDGFSNPILSWVTNLFRLRSLELSVEDEEEDVSRSKSIPRGLGNLTHLRELYLYVDMLSGIIPCELGNLSRLQQLDLSFFMGSSPIPSCLQKLQQLESFSFGGEHVTSSIPPELGNLSLLLELSLELGWLNGGIPWQLGNLSRLQSLDLFFSNEHLRPWECYHSFNTCPS